MHPYSHLEDCKFWRRSVTPSSWRDIAFLDNPKFQLQTGYKIATAGSCFAQHISRYLREAGNATFTAETPHPISREFGGETESYGLFSARYGNIYSIRQCLELFRQAFCLMPVIDDYFEESGRTYDLLRPNAIPNGFANLSEARHDRRFHLSRVRHMFETTDVFIFTLGLTECWLNSVHGHTYPVCPGTARGSYDPAKYHFHNFTHAEIVADLQEFIQELQTVNANIKLILTVSPVPLVATYTSNNVLIASSYSKSVLRAACGEVALDHSNVQYFPSFEIVGHVASFGQYLASDLRDISERGVAHVMSCFYAAFFGSSLTAAAEANKNTPTNLVHSNLPKQSSLDIVSAECEELFNEVTRTA